MITEKEMPGTITCEHCRKEYSVFGHIDNVAKNLRMGTSPSSLQTKCPFCDQLELWGTSIKFADICIQHLLEIDIS